METKVEMRNEFEIFKFLKTDEEFKTNIDNVLNDLNLNKDDFYEDYENWKNGNKNYKIKLDDLELMFSMIKHEKDCVDQLKNALSNSGYNMDEFMVRYNDWKTKEFDNTIDLPKNISEELEKELTSDDLFDNIEKNYDK